MINDLLFGVPDNNLSVPLNAPSSFPTCVTVDLGNVAAIISLAAQDSSRLCHTKLILLFFLPRYPILSSHAVPFPLRRNLCMRWHRRNLTPVPSSAFCCSMHVANNPRCCLRWDVLELTMTSVTCVYAPGKWMSNCTSDGAIQTFFPGCRGSLHCCLSSSTSPICGESLVSAITYTFAPTWPDRVHSRAALVTQKRSEAGSDVLLRCDWNV